MPPVSLTTPAPAATPPSAFSIEAPPNNTPTNSYFVDPFAAVSETTADTSATTPTPSPSPSADSTLAAEQPAAAITPPPNGTTTTPPPLTTASLTPSTPPISATELLARMPSIEEMMQDLEKSGCLLPDLAVQPVQATDHSPLANLQPGQQQPFFSSPTASTKQKNLPDVQLTVTGKQKPAGRPVEMPVYIFIAVIALLQSLMAIVVILHYTFVKYRELELMITAGIMSTEEVNTVSVKVAIVGLVGFISFISAVRLLLKKSGNHSVPTYLAVCLIILNFVAQNVIGRNQFAAGNPLLLPETIAQILTALQQPRF